MPLFITSKKSYCPWSRENIARVERDEQLHREAQEAQSRNDRHENGIIRHRQLIQSNHNNNYKSGNEDGTTTSSSGFSLFEEPTSVKRTEMKVIGAQSEQRRQNVTEQQTFGVFSTQSSSISRFSAINRNLSNGPETDKVSVSVNRRHIPSRSSSTIAAEKDRKQKQLLDPTTAFLPLFNGEGPATKSKNPSISGPNELTSLRYDSSRERRRHGLEDESTTNDYNTSKRPSSDQAHTDHRRKRKRQRNDDNLESSSSVLSGSSSLSCSSSIESESESESNDNKEKRRRKKKKRRREKKKTSKKSKDDDRKRKRKSGSSSKTAEKHQRRKRRHDHEHKRNSKDRMSSTSDVTVTDS